MLPENFQQQGIRRLTDAVRKRWIRSGIRIDENVYHPVVIWNYLSQRIEVNTSETNGF